MKLEMIVLPVTDVDRAKAFYEQVGFNTDVDHAMGDDFRVVQLTPPGSACSISIGIGLTGAEPGSAQGLHLVVGDVERAREDLVGRGVEVGEVFHFEPSGQVPGPDPARADYGSFAQFTDPDHNVWLLQEVGHSAAAS